MTDRPTRDFDVLAPSLSADISSAAKSFARKQRGLGVELADDWLNNGPMQLTDVLPSDFRVLSVLTTWLGVHHTHVNADRLIRLVAGHDSIRVRAYWSGIAKWLAKDRRFARLISKQAKVDLLSVGTDFQLKRKGEDERFAASTLRVPRETLRDRDDDVLPAEVLAKRHAGFRNRVVIGPTWRADVWTILEKAPQLSAAEAARRASCSFAAAWQATRDFRALHPSRSTS